MLTRSTTPRWKRTSLLKAKSWKLKCSEFHYLLDGGSRGPDVNFKMVHSSRLRAPIPTLWICSGDDNWQGWNSRTVLARFPVASWMKTMHDESFENQSHQIFFYCKLSSKLRLKKSNHHFVIWCDRVAVYYIAHTYGSRLSIQPSHDPWADNYRSTIASR